MESPRGTVNVLETNILSKVGKNETRAERMNRRMSMIERVVGAIPC